MRFCLYCMQVRVLDCCISYPWKILSSEDDFPTSSEAKCRGFHLKMGILTYFHFLGTFTKLFMQCQMRQTLNFQKELWSWIANLCFMISKMLISKIFSKAYTYVVKEIILYIFFEGLYDLVGLFHLQFHPFWWQTAKNAEYCFSPLRSIWGM